MLKVRRMFTAIRHRWDEIAKKGRKRKGDVRIHSLVFCWLAGWLANRYIHLPERVICREDEEGNESRFSDVLRRRRRRLIVQIKSPIFVCSCKRWRRRTRKSKRICNLLIDFLIHGFLSFSLLATICCWCCVFCSSSFVIILHDLSLLHLSFTFYCCCYTLCVLCIVIGLLLFDTPDFSLTFGVQLLALKTLNNSSKKIFVLLNTTLCKQRRYIVVDVLLQLLV